jgi:hypothetical protein
MRHMDKCQFSEFSYGYCLTEDLIVGKGTALTAAPVFPSLIEEGQPGVGYDVQLNRPGTPLFLQFKLVHQMVRGNATEARRGDFQPPFYRMHLRPTGISDQHNSLLALEQAGNEVFYVAPAFHTSAALNTAYAARRVWDDSFRIRPSMIAALPDDKDHHVTFRTSTGNWRRYSDEPSAERHAPTTNEISASLQEKIKERGKRTFREQLTDIDASLLEIVNARNARRLDHERINVNELETYADPVRRVAYVARQFFDCQLLFVSLKPDPGIQVDTP